jgi:phage terminase large subunit-like protein
VTLALLEAALDDSVPLPVLYVTLTRGNAKEIIWDELLRLNEEFKLGFTIKEGALDLVSPKGIKIQLRGAHTKREVSKYRGKKYKLVVIDEMQSFPDNVIESLVTDAIMPTLLDVGGTLWLVGTRPALRKGYFWRCFSGDLAEGKELHSWTVLENEKLPAVLSGRSIEEVLAEFRKDNGWAEDNKTYRREILDEDIEDRDALLFQFHKDKNAYETLPEGEWANVLCWDLGIGGDEEKANEGATMYIAILGWRKGTREVYLREEWAGNKAGDDKADITDAAAEAHKLAAKYKPISMVIDQGALGKLIAEEIRRRHGLPVKAAEKTHKGAFIELFNTAMRKGEFFARADSVFAQECELVHKDFAALANGGKLQELPASKGGFHGNATDGVLYGWRECKAFWEKDEPARPPGYEPPSEHIQDVLEQQRREQYMDPEAAALGYE